jgi:hypothetical protein
MTNSIKVLLQMQNGFLQLESTLLTLENSALHVEKITTVIFKFPATSKPNPKLIKLLKKKLNETFHCDTCFFFIIYSNSRTLVTISLASRLCGL